MNPQENGNEPSTLIAEVKPVVPICGACKNSPSKLSVSPIQFGDMICNVFYCGDCGAIFNFAVMPRQEIRLDRLVDPRIVGGGKF